MASRQALRLSVVGLMLTTLAGCSPSFAVGDCIRIERNVLDHDLEAADCSDAVGTFNPEERIYRIDEVIDGTDGGCSMPEGFFPVEFVHEPDGVTYCMTQEG